MSLTNGLIAFALRQVSEAGGDVLGEWITDHFTDHSAALPRAVDRAHGRAWEAVGLALGGEGNWGGWFKDRWRDADLKAMRERVRIFLSATPTGLAAIDQAVKTSAFAEWQRLDKAKRFTLTGLHGADLARATAGLAVASAPAHFAAGATLAIVNTADALHVEAPSLSALLRLAPPDGVPLLASAFLFFLRREIEQDEELARGLTLDTMRLLGADTRRGFAELELALGDKLDEIRQEQHEIKKKLDELLSRQPANTGPTAPFVISVTSEAELAQLRAIRDRMRTMPPGTVGASLWDKLGDAERVAGEAEFAQASHTAAAEAARVAQDRAAEAASRFKAFRDACEASRWTEAMDSLRRAVDLDPTYEPFPFERYEPLALLGVGGFGAVFHCRDCITEDEVAVKSLFDTDLDRTVRKIFAEAHALRTLSHPGIIGIREQTFADFKNKRRPYFVLEYFAGKSLEAVGTLSPLDLAEVARRVAEAVGAAHVANILHHDLKPANVLAFESKDGWSTRVIDFGLAIRQATIGAAKQTKRDKSFSNTFRYSAPERRGDLRDVPTGRYSDVYSFGKLCVGMLFGHLEPHDDDWNDLPNPWRGRWRKLIGGCLRRDVTGPRARHAGFDAVLAEMRGWELQLDEPLAPKAKTLPAVVPAATKVVPPAPKEVPPPVVLLPTKPLPPPTPKEAPPASRPLEPNPGDVLIVPGVEMKFAWIPPGSFQMGSNALSHEETPIHEVTLSKGCYMGIVPVTQAQWRWVMGNDSRPSHFQGDDHPVENISWHDCQAFLVELRKRIDKPVRLPTEAEWERACRAGSGVTMDYYSGDDEEALGRVGWYEGNSNGETHPVGQKEPNCWGLLDMHGNVWEWCQDWYDGTYYQKSNNKDPEGPKTGRSRVLRGGSWANDPVSCRSTFRDWNDPEDRDDVFGFRVCFTPLAPMVETLTLLHSQLPALVVQPRTAQQRLAQRLTFSSDDELATLFNIEIPVADAAQLLIMLDRNDPTDSNDDGFRVCIAPITPKAETLSVVVPDTKMDSTAMKRVFPTTVVQPTKAVPQPMPKVLSPSPRPSTPNPGDVLTVAGVMMIFAWMPPGSFQMGSNAERAEKPIREVSLTKGYYMGIVPVTQAQWRWVMGDDSRPSHFRGDDRPVENVTWHDCQAFLVELRKRIGRPVRLPTEAEWEHACRAGSNLTTDYHSGNDEKALARVGWYDGNSNHQTHPFGKKEPNRWGLYDMHGNVFEWCQDWYDENYYQKADNKDPLGPQSGSSCVLRGGSWYHVPGHCRAAYRGRSAPMGRNHSIGFRVCFTPLATMVETLSVVAATKMVPLAPKEVPPPVVLLLPKAVPQPTPKVLSPAPRPLTPNPGDVLIVPGVEMKFAWIPPGSFQMGGAAHEDEKPIREVSLTKGYHMGIVPVTQAQWRWVMGNDSRPSHFQGDDHPVENISWHDCQAFLVELRKRIDKPVRLPTEAEWEHACRAGTGITTDYYSGNDEKALARVGWYKGNSDKQTHPVGQKEPNGWGLYDMHGNVWEWCQDWYDAGYYQKADNKDPKGPQYGSFRVLRGCSWGGERVSCRAACRNRNAPAGRAYVYGFRVCFAWTN